MSVGQNFATLLLATFALAAACGDGSESGVAHNGGGTAGGPDSAGGETEVAGAAEQSSGGDRNSSGAAGTAESAGAGGGGQGGVGAMAGAGVAGSVRVSGEGGALVTQGGGSGDGGAGGESSSPPASRGSLGAACQTREDCAEDLECLTSYLNVDAAPPHGLCTRPCSEANEVGDAECEQFSPGALCLPIAGDERYCFEGCAVGRAQASLGVAKCHGREDFSCGAQFFGRDGTSCDIETGLGCAEGRFCATDGTCIHPIAACHPSCRGDFDCPGGYCDFYLGDCLKQEPPGLPLGSACTTPGSTTECKGFCGTASSPICEANCSLTPDNTGCGWDGTGVANAACIDLSRSFFPEEDLTFGDDARCAKLCDCNADCQPEGFYCLDKGPHIQQTWGRNGVCAPLGDVSPDLTFQTCGSSG